MSTENTALRWVLYDGIYYAAILVPATEAPVSVPKGSAFVFFLDGESGALVPDSDVSPFDADDKEKAENPAAVAGVRIACEILRGASGAAAAVGSAETALDGDDELLLQQLLAVNDDADADAGAENEEDADRAERRRLAKEEKQRRKEERAARKAEKKKKKREREEASDDDDDDRSEASSHDEDDDDEVTGARARKAAAKKRTAATTDLSHWSDLADVLEPNDEDGDPFNDNGGLLSRGAQSRRMAQVRGGGGGGARTGLSAGLSALMDSGSPVSVYLAEIRHHYQALHDEAQARGMVLSATEQAVVASIDTIVRRNMATAQYLEHELEKAETAAQEHDGSDAHADHAEDKKKAKRNKAKVVPEALAKQREAVAAVVERLSSDPNIELLVKQMAQIQPGPDAERADGQRRRFTAPSSASGSSFMDTAFALHLREVASSNATPLPMTTDLAAKLREQRTYRERILNYRKGLGKAGLTAPVITPFADWHRTRELMVMAPAIETQPVRPAAYISRRYSTLTAKREELALRRLSTGMPTNMSLETRQSTASLTAPPNGSLAQNSFLSSQQDLLTSYMSSTRRARQMLPAYYDFNALRPSTTGGRAGSGADGNGLSGTNAGLAGVGGDENQLVFRSAHDAGLFMSQLDDDNGEVRGMPSVALPELAVKFDPRAEFAVGAEEIHDEQERAAQLAARSQMYSNSVYLPSEESHWFDSVAYHAGSTGSGAEGGTSRHRSRASSAGRSASHHHDRDGGDASVVAGGSSSSKSKGRVKDWRESAKRAILERLTLYLRGVKGFPAVLDESTFKALAKKLLDRAVQAESQRSGASMMLQVNNESVEFTKQTERQLKASVDNYVKRHFIDQEAPARPVHAASERRSESPRSEENSPVYDN